MPIVDPSPWPLMTSMGAFLTTFSGVMYMHSYKNGGVFLLFGGLIILYGMFVWWRDVVREGTFEGQHTLYVQRGLRFGMILFITSEVMFVRVKKYIKVSY